MNTKTFKITELTVSSHNVRAAVEPAPETVQALADNIIAIHTDGRLIHPITVQEVDGKGQVVAGKTRMLALQYLIEDGRLPADATTECFIVESDAEAVLVSQSENLQREQMHPVAEFAGFQKLVDEGHSIESIALAFGVTNRYVEGRLRLANVAPVLLEAFEKKNHPNLEQVMALALTDDHARQIAVWEQRKDYQWQSTPRHLRDALAGDGTIDASTDRRMKLVSIEDYKAAGGRVQASLLTEHAYLLDAELFEQLVADKMNGIAAEVQSEGWSWVEVFQDDAYSAMNKLGTTQPETRTPTDDERAELDRLHEAVESASEHYNEVEESDEEEAAGEKLEEAEAALEAYKEQFYTYTAEQKSFAGAVVFLDHTGALEVRRGLVRREDRRALDEAARQGRVAAGATGGRTTGDAGRPAEAMSAALKDDLRGLRILAVQNVLAKNARVAKVLMALWAVDAIRGRISYTDRLPMDLHINGNYSLRSRLGQMGPEVKAAREAQDDAFEAVFASLPEGQAECWDALVAMTDEQLDSLIAYGVALSVSPDDEHAGVTGRLLDALDFDMADHFQATPETYTNRVPKKLVIEALTEVGKAEDADALAAMKKKALAETAAERLAGTGWVPELIRTPDREPKAKEAKDATPSGKKPAAKKAAAKKPAKKASAKKPAGKPAKQ